MGFIVDAIGGLLGAHAKNKQTDKAIAGYTDAQNTATQGYNAFNTQTRADYAPYYQAGTGALGRLTALTTPGQAFDATQVDPSYAWDKSEGINAVDRGAAAKSGVFSGGTLKALDRFGSGLASHEFQNIFNRNATLAGYGLDAAGAGAQAGAITAKGVGDSAFRGAEGRASGYGVKGDTNQGLWGALTGGLQTAQQNVFNAFGGF